MCGPSRWKREQVREHKFDYIDIEEFHDSSCLTRLGYLSIYFMVLKSFLVYVADLWSGVSLLVVGQTSDNENAAIPPNVSKWIFLGAIMVSFLLLFWDIRKARGVIATRDISWAYTSQIASRYYSLKDYNYYCLFYKISNSRKFVDSIAFFCFFTLKGWKRLLLAEAPRQVINVVTLKVLIPNWIQLKQGDGISLTLDNSALGKTVIQKIMTGTMAFSFVIFAFSFVSVVIAMILYLPLLCHIQGNLKEYCCHKVDKRISYLLQKQVEKRRRNKKNKTHPHHHHHHHKKEQDIEMKSFPQPTLPQINNNRRYSGSSFQSHDQMGLTSNIQSQPRSGYQPSPYYPPQQEDYLYPYQLGPQLSVSNIPYYAQPTSQPHQQLYQPTTPSYSHPY
ncbi:hypothetical protein BJ944DRAFT_253600 [Cunninghamella echinulata]|nr:hypothetical protein BJ944DRAFT_253600 [Cunninghamella echinulata]